MVISGTSGRRPNPYSRLILSEVLGTSGAVAQYCSMSLFSCEARFWAWECGRKSSHGFAVLFKKVGIHFWDRM